MIIWNVVNLRKKVELVVVEIKVLIFYNLVATDHLGMKGTV
jgi:hypothetical protein